MVIGIIIYATMAAISWLLLDDMRGWRRAVRAVVTPAASAVLLVAMALIAFLSLPRWIA